MNRKTNYDQHGMSYSPEYYIWRSMLTRCRNPNTRAYYRYGGRGITVCKRWYKFRNFLDDMGRRPSPELQIDREDNDGNYTPENCRWVTRLVNKLNSDAPKLSPSKVKEIKILLRVGFQTQKEIGKKFGISQQHISAINTGRTWSRIN